MKNTVQKENKVSQKVWPLIVVICIVIVVWIVLGAIMYFISRDWDDRGSFGDMFGSVNTLFSGLAFAGLVYTIALQRKEFELQKESLDKQTEELELLKNETARSADQLEDQRKLMNFQIILSTVNNMLNVINDVKMKIVTKAGYHGVEGIKFIVENEKNDSTIDGQRDSFNDYLSVFFDILQYIQVSNLDPEQKNELVKIVFVSTSSVEYHVLRIYSKNNQHRSALLKSFGFPDKIKSRELSEFGYEL